MPRYSSLCALCLLMGAALLSGCQKSYVVTYAMVIGPAWEPDPDFIGSREGADSHLMILRSQKLWRDYVVPKLGSAAAADAIHGGLTMRLMGVHQIGKEEIADFQLTLGVGGAAEADAVIAGYLDFLRELEQKATATAKTELQRLIKDASPAQERVIAQRMVEVEKPRVDYRILKRTPKD